MKRNLVFCTILTLCFTQNLKAQLAASTKVIVAEQYLKKANEAYDKKDYSAALDYYLVVLSDWPKRVPLYWKIAESAFNTHKVNIAGKYYEELAKTDSAKTYNLLNYRRAIVKKMAGKYDEAITLLNTYQANQQVATANGGNFFQDIQDEIASCEWAKTIEAIQPKFEAKPLDKIINTDLTDIAAVQYGNTLYYTTANLVENKKPVTQVFTSDFKEKSRLSNVNMVKDSLSTAGYSLNTEGSRVYFNICEQKDNTNFRCEIYYREKLLDDRWSEPKKLSETINNQAFTASNPTVGRDKTTGKDVLYFASNRPGGKGKLDIWYADLDEKGQASAPQNLSNVNTSKDDITPYFFNEGQILFFSSEGHKGMGGLDIFHVEKTGDNSWSAVNNAGKPINSSFDDTYFSINGDKGQGYFSTNRKGKTCTEDDKNCVCNDIFNYEVKADLKAETFAQSTKENLIGCRLDLVDVETGEIIQTVTNANANDFNFPLELNKKYRLIASKPNHVTDSIDFDTKGLWQTKTLYQKLELVAYPKLTVYVMDEIDRKPLDGAKVDIWEIDANKNPKRVASEILKGSVFTWDKLEFGKTYRITGYKETFDPDTNQIIVDNYTPKGLNRLDYVDTLFLLPFRGLPLTLYFDNDHPNPNSRDTLTFLTYGETFAAYSAKEGEYLSFIYKNGGKTRNAKAKKGNKIGKIGKPSPPDDSNVDPFSAAQASAVSAFFNDKIRANYSKLVSFSGLMRRYLSRGQTLEIVIEGYASPLAETEYNRYLTSRRIMSLYNHFYQFDGGNLRQYLLNNQLRIRVLPYGEAKSERTVSDDANDPRRSIFSVEAMKERKVEIKEINLLNDTIRGLSYELKQFLDTKELLSFLDNKLEVESGLSRRILPGSYSKTGVMVGNELVAKGVKKNTTGKQRVETVLIDVYTGEVIGKNGFIEIVDQDGKNLASKAKRKGDNYRYDLPTDKNLTIKSRVAGYNEVSKGSNALYTEGDETKADTVFLTPFSGLPLSLYFDNDRPDPNTQKSKTTSPYDKSYKSYYAQKSTFIRKYNSILSKQGSVPNAINEMEQFFNVDVQKGFETLDGYAYIIKTYLEQGLSIDVVIEGYASPLANASYNEYLTQRRINSVINFFSTYGGGNLSKYVKNGHLKLKVRPLGETQAASNVSDDGKDPQNSIYGLDASRERRVVIKDILIKR
jgi:outer membrane protein OmpA-like peptidoglycan-associated protein